MLGSPILLVDANEIVESAIRCRVMLLTEDGLFTSMALRCPAQVYKRGSKGRDSAAAVLEVDARCASQSLRALVSMGGLLAVVPGPVTCFKDSSFRQVPPWHEQRNDVGNALSAAPLSRCYDPCLFCRCRFVERERELYSKYVLLASVFFVCLSFLLEYVDLVVFGVVLWYSFVLSTPAMRSLQPRAHAHTARAR